MPIRLTTGSAAPIHGANEGLSKPQFVGSLRVVHPDYNEHEVSISDSTWSGVVNLGLPWWICPGEGYSYKVLWPNGGETLFVGDTVLIKLCSVDPQEYDVVRIPPILTYDNGKSWITLGDVQNVGNRVHWVVRDSLLDVFAGGMVSIMTDECRIRVQDYVDTDIYDDSDEPFTIARPE
jgi:hypothetical protein